MRRSSTGFAVHTGCLLISRSSSSIFQMSIPPSDVVVVVIVVIVIMVTIPPKPYLRLMVFLVEEKYQNMYILICFFYKVLYLIVDT